MIYPDFVMIPGGWFLMGCAQGQENERPCHRVWVDDFAIGRFPVVNREYKAFLDSTSTTAPAFLSDPIFSDPQQPVVGISWDEALAYCRWLTARTGKEMRLPSEAEWEYAARGGREGALYPWGDEPPDDERLIGCDPVTGGPARVGVNPPNGYGLYDMSESVHEWCADYYGYDYYRHSPDRNPPGPAFGQRRVSRGGSWRHRIKFSRCAARSSLPPNFKYADYGFRVALAIR